MPATSRHVPPAGPIPGLLLLRVRGVPVLLAPSWWLISLLIVVLYTPLVRRLLPEIGLGAAAVLAAAFVLLLGVSVLLHELGHCFVALSLGLPVRRIRLQFLGGVAELVRPPNKASQEGMIAAAGPLVSLTLAALFAGFLPIVEPRGVLWLLVAQVAAANAVVGAFNLLPGLPLDGGRVLRAVVWAASGRRGTGTKAAAIGGTVVAVLLAWWALAGLFATSDDRWLRLCACVGMIWFIAWGIGAELALGARRPWPARLRLDQLMRPVLQLPSESPVADALAASAGRGVVLVRADGVAVGLLDRRTAEDLAAISPASPAEYAAEPITAENVVLDSEPGQEIAERVRSTSARQFLVVDTDGRPSGVLRREDLRAALGAE